MDEYVKTAGQLRDQLGSVMSNNDVLYPLLAAIGAGGVGGVLSSRTPKKPGESRAERRKRILRSALLSAAAGGGATALFRGGMDQFGTALPPKSDNPTKGVFELGLRGGGAVGGGALLGRSVGKGREDAASTLLSSLQLESRKNKGDFNKVRDFTAGDNPAASKFRRMYQELVENSDGDMRKLVDSINQRPRVDALADRMGLSGSLAGDVRSSGKSLWNAAKNRDAGAFYDDTQQGMGRLTQSRAAQELKRQVQRHPRIAGAAGGALAAPTAFAMGKGLVGGLAPNILEYD